MKEALNMKTAMNKCSLRFLLLLSLTTSLTFLNFAQAKVETILGSVAVKDNLNLAGVLPNSDLSEIIISREQLLISYNKTRRAPNWVAWKIEADQIGSSGRSNNFVTDTELDTYLSQENAPRAVGPAEYKGSCFDRGHQTPSADRSDTVQNNEATFVMSNMIPQNAYLNRVVWEHLEQYTRDLVQKQGKKVYIIAGPIYDEDFGVIGTNKDIPVPSKDFKVIAILNANQGPADINSNTEMIAVVMPNLLPDGSKQNTDGSPCKSYSQKTPSRDDWQKYKTTVTEIERLSGVKILSAFIKNSTIEDGSELK